jgi:hypothetical protein
MVKKARSYKENPIHSEVEKECVSRFKVTWMLDGDHSFKPKKSWGRIEQR